MCGVGVVCWCVVCVVMCRGVLCFVVAHCGALWCDAHGKKHLNFFQTGVTQTGVPKRKLQFSAGKLRTQKFVLPVFFRKKQKT